MLERSVMLMLVTLALLLGALSPATGELQLVHHDGKSLPHVHLVTGSSGGRTSRQAGRQSIRITPFYDSTVDQVEASKQAMIRDDIIPDLLSFLAQVLRVTRSTDPIRLSNQCGSNSIFIAEDGRILCPNQCLAITRCGVSQVPTEHLMQCWQCNGADGCPNPVVGTPSQNGAGVTNTDFVLYISANQSACPPLPDNPNQPTTVAFASHCQLESTIDRPVAGSINFCPEGIGRNRDGLRYISAVTKHEILHAIGFSRSLFPYWHDSNGDPRTPRNGQQRPTVAATTTIRSLSYPGWNTRNGDITHRVMALVTPAVVAAGRMHFGCDSLQGVELENQGGQGTAMDHWEKRILGNEAMTGVFTFNPVFSNLTLAALYDSGWYDVDFTMAEDLVWGRGEGCDFVMQSCRQRIAEQVQQNGANGLFPICNEAGRFGCTADRLSVAQCNLVTPARSAVDPEFQYFSNANSGGSLTVADFCPYYQMVTLNSRSPVCSDTSNAPSANNLLESYGPSSRCLTHGRSWVNGQVAAPFSGGGCYQYSCSRDSGVTITINGQSHTCNCTGEEVIINMTVNGVLHFGSVICPACEDICHDSLAQCPTSVNSCYGRMVAVGGEVLENVVDPPISAAVLTTFATSWLALFSLPLLIISVHGF